MTFDELALQLAIELIRKSGVREWEDEGKCAAITLAASQMAATILYYGGAGVSNEIYLKHGTAIVFGSEVTDDVAWTSEAIGNGAGRQSAFHDQGAEGTARPERWQYRIYTQADATPTLGNIFQCYLKTSDGTHPDNDDGAGDAAVSAADKLKNLTPLRSPIVDQAAANIEFVGHGTIRIPQRYFAVAGWNGMGSAVTNDAAETKIVMTPIYDQSQA